MDFEEVPREPPPPPKRPTVIRPGANTGENSDASSLPVPTRPAPAIPSRAAPSPQPQGLPPPVKHPPARPQAFLNLGTPPPIPARVAPPVPAAHPTPVSRVTPGDNQHVGPPPPKPSAPFPLIKRDNRPPAKPKPSVSSKPVSDGKQGSVRKRPEITIVAARPMSEVGFRMDGPVITSPTAPVEGPVGTPAAASKNNSPPPRPNKPGPPSRPASLPAGKGGNILPITTPTETSEVDLPPHDKPLLPLDDSASDTCTPPLKPRLGNMGDEDTECGGIMPPPRPKSFRKPPPVPSSHPCARLKADESWDDSPPPAPPTRSASLHSKKSEENRLKDINEFKEDQIEGTSKRPTIIRPKAGGAIELQNTIGSAATEGCAKVAPPVPSHRTAGTAILDSETSEKTQKDMSEEPDYRATKPKPTVIAPKPKPKPTVKPINMDQPSGVDMKISRDENKTQSIKNMLEKNLSAFSQIEDDSKPKESVVKRPTIIRGPPKPQRASLSKADGSLPVDSNEEETRALPVPGQTSYIAEKCAGENPTISYDIKSKNVQSGSDSKNSKVDISLLEEELGIRVANLQPQIPNANPKSTFDELLLLEQNTEQKHEISEQKLEITAPSKPLPSRPKTSPLNKLFNKTEKQNEDQKLDANIIVTADLLGLEADNHNEDKLACLKGGSPGKQKIGPPPPRPQGLPEKTKKEVQKETKLSKRNNKEMKGKPFKNDKGPPPTLPARPGPGHPLYHYVVSGPHGIAIHDYNTGHHDELAFTAGDVIALVSRVDVDWLIGRLGDKEGMFPVGFIDIVEPLSQDAGVAVKGSSPEKPDNGVGPRCRARFDYDGEMPEDLAFEDGDIIQLLERIGDDWYKGQIDGRTGLFPMAFVEIIEDLPLDEGQVDMTFIAKATIADPLVVTAVYDFEGQANELSFKIGDQIKPLSIVSENWLYGELHGVQGNFPTAFVDHVPTGLPAYGMKVNTSTSDSDVYCIAKFSFTAEGDNELTIHEGDRITVTENTGGDWLKGRLNGKEGMFPSAFVEMVEALGPVPSSTSFFKEDGPKAKAVYAFTGQGPEELTFKEGDIIYLLDKINEDWYQGEINNNRGQFPIGFVEIIHPLP